MVSLSPVSASIISFSLNLGIGFLGNVGETSPFSDLSIPVQQRANDPYLLSLLNWKFRLSEFAGRDQELSTLNEWANSEPAISMKFISGAGGVGKTRLAVHFAEQLKEKGWEAGFLKLDGTSKFHLGKKGTLLIIDYPEEYASQIPILFRDLASYGNSKFRLRVLFLTRQPISEWLDKAIQNHAIGLLEKAPLELEKLSGESAHKIYISTLGEASVVFGKETPEGVSVKMLADWLEQYPEHNRPLFILAAALHSALNPEDNFLRYTSKEVVIALADRELTRLRQIAKTNDFVDPEVLIKIVTIATLLENISFTEIIELIEQGLISWIGTERELREMIKSSGVSVDEYVPAVRPDIPAAAFIVKALSNDPKSAPEIVWAGLGEDMYSGLKRLARFNHDAEVECGIRDFRLRDYLEKAVAGNIDRCRILDSTVKSNPVLGWVDSLITAREALLNHASSEEERARILNNLSIDLATRGDDEKALTIGQEAVEIHRKLANINPKRYLPDLAMSLNNLSIRLNTTNNKKKALSVIKESVHIYQKLVDSGLLKYLPGLAQSLNNLSNLLSDSQNSKEALSVIRNAVRIRRKLANTNPSFYLSSLAESLNNLSNCLKNMGNNKEALQIIQEAVDIYQKLAEDEPERYLTCLAGCLVNLSECLNDNGNKEKALIVIEESVDIYRRMAVVEPKLYLPDIAHSLNALSNILSDIGNHEEALKAIQEANGIYQQLVKSEPERYLPALAGSINNLSNRLNDIGDHYKSLELIHEAVNINRKLANVDPLRYYPNLAQSLMNLSNRLHEIGNNEQVLPNIQEAVGIYRTLAEHQPEFFYSDLCQGLNNLLVCLIELGDEQESFKIFKELESTKIKIKDSYNS